MFWSVCCVQLNSACSPVFLRLNHGEVQLFISFPSCWSPLIGIKILLRAIVFPLRVWFKCRQVFTQQFWSSSSFLSIVPSSGPQSSDRLVSSLSAQFQFTQSCQFVWFPSIVSSIILELVKSCWFQQQAVHCVSFSFVSRHVSLSEWSSSSQSSFLEAGAVRSSSCQCHPLDSQSLEHLVPSLSAQLYSLSSRPGTTLCCVLFFVLHLQGNRFQTVSFRAVLSPS